jgi:hypothetical protein
MTRLREYEWQESFTSSQDNLLEGFYRPALQESIRYWRITGYFSSRSLLQVLDGVEQLVLASPDGRGHGQMRLITGFFMSRADLQALGSEQSPEQLLEQQLSRQFPFRDVQPGDGSAADLGAELLAWLVHQGHLEIRVGLPMLEGRISSDGAIFHAKEGVIEDSNGDRIAFTGSINETPNGWTTNYETFDVFCSWKGEEHRVDAKERHFLRLWQNEDPGVRTLSLPEAFRQQLAIYAPAEGALPRRLKPYLKDLPSPEPEAVVESVPDIDERRRIVWSYVLQAAASDLPGAERVGEGISAVTPWPHQQRAFQRLWQQWPPRLLIADEVGLGKTVQAGLLLRQAWLSGRARRMLVMAPASVLKQWQRELREKFGLDWPIYSGKSLDWQPTRFRPAGLSRTVDRSSWTSEPFVLVSSHLMARIASFENIVGKLQPILAKASSSIAQATLANRKQREQARSEAVVSIEHEPEIKGLDLDDGLHDLDAIKAVITQLQPPPLTLADLEAILDRPELLPPGCSATRIGACDFKWTQPGLDQEMRITCNASYYEDNSDSCELWVPGSPLFPETALHSVELESEPKRREDFERALSP